MARKKLPNRIEIALLKKELDVETTARFAIILDLLKQLGDSSEETISIDFFDSTVTYDKSSHINSSTDIIKDKLDELDDILKTRVEKYAKRRKPDEIGGDARDEKNAPSVKLGGRIPRELSDRFNEFLQDNPDWTPKTALTEAIEKFLLEQLDIE